MELHAKAPNTIAGLRVQRPFLEIPLVIVSVLISCDADHLRECLATDNLVPAICRRFG